LTQPEWQKNTVFFAFVSSLLLSFREIEDAIPLQTAKNWNLESSMKKHNYLLAGVNEIATQ
jgi:hypothetical protein